VRDRPEGVTERDLARALADGWGLSAGSLRYAPVGHGSYHWAVTGDQGDQWFVTVDDLDDKAWLGRTRPDVFAGLRAAMAAAVTLRRDASLGFVVAPVPARDGAPVRPLGGRYAVAVFPFLRGEPGQWGEPLPAPERDELVAMLAALHRVDPAAVRLPRPGLEPSRPAPELPRSGLEPSRSAPKLPRSGLGLSWRGELEQALRDLGRPWAGGPFAEPARALLAGAAGPVRRQLDALDRQAGALAARPPAITHGEPHPGNVFRPARGGLMLIDWDTVALAPPERDLWMVATGTGGELRRYTELTGRPVNHALLETYRLRWALDDISCFVRDLRARHRRTPGTEQAWQALEISIAQLTHLLEPFTG
jgi:spectinomycin phosphotransferase